MRLTGGTYNNNVFSFITNTGSTVSIGINSMTGLTVNGTLSATTISGGTLYGNGRYITNLVYKLVRHDFVSSNSIGYSYCGTAPNGSVESGTTWEIKRITVALDGTTFINTATNAAWTNRYNATYI